mmetsp:Transcript_17048/g.24102  ORF Transcript_17048/g.24102 Transcript_17048/m.24102 type:complete len:236 (-) Transcript_17048:35-742(-)
MRRSSPQKDIEQGGGRRAIDPIDRNIDPLPSNSDNSSSFQSATTYYSSPPNTTNIGVGSVVPLQKILTTILLDTLYGTLLALLFLTLLFTLDYHSFISIGSTKAFQQVGQELLSDPEVITAIESSLSLKLLPLSHYQGIQMEIDSNHELIQSTTTLSKYTQQLTALHDEIASIQSEHESVTKNINDKLGLDQWCGDCKGAWGKCDGRVEYLRSTYGNSVLMSKVDIMKEGLCKKG